MCVYFFRNPGNDLFHSLRPASGHSVSESALSAGITKSHQATGSNIIIIDNFCIALFSGVPKLDALYNILQHFLSFTNVIHVIINISIYSSLHCIGDRWNL